MNIKLLSVWLFSTLLLLVNCDNLTIDDKLTPGDSLFR